MATFGPARKIASVDAGKVLPTAGTLTAPGTYEFDVSGYDGWVIAVTIASIDTNVVYKFEAAYYGEDDWSTVLYQHIGQAGTAIGAAGSVTAVGNGRTTYKFLRQHIANAGLECIGAGKFRINWVSEAGGTAAVITVELQAAFTNAV